MVRLVEGLLKGGGVDAGVERLAKEVKSLEAYLLAECRDKTKHAERERERDTQTTETLHELDRRVAEALSRQVDVQDGLALFNKLQTSVLLPTGIGTLDALLGGGLREGQITEFFGASPSGKTQVCHCISACAAWLGYPVVYMTSNGSFSPERLVKLSKHVLVHFDLSETEVVESLSKILPNVSVTQVNDTLSLISIFQGMIENFGYLQKHDKPIPKVVVVDSPSLHLYRDLSIGQQNFGKLLMTQLSTAMSELANRYNIAVVLTNHEVRQFSPLRGDGRQAAADRDHVDGPGASPATDQGKPGLGLLWQPQVNVRVHLKMHRVERLDDGLAGGPEGPGKESNERAVVCKATLIKSSTGNCGREAWMIMGNRLIQGIENPHNTENCEVRDVSVWN
ncbi:DNA repair protein Rad51 [Chloropicon primus]|uniref:DNA repair protein Rad51 n=2 Tax=Chloropicon primus TaxID=1764295 RepID=A0A5B8MZ88_9CHLO|nr:DNA repair protein Rad51 [Chloropicon primus]UPR04060.1 DNA repair protein Rad51 [Chloropicon primus]|eukprot:QDZ24850.1 DNA repair protein Rad51 [Chloropicon primus]